MSDDVSMGEKSGDARLPIAPRRAHLKLLKRGPPCRAGGEDPRGARLHLHVHAHERQAQIVQDRTAQTAEEGFGRRTTSAAGRIGAVRRARAQPAEELGGVEAEALVHPGAPGVRVCVGRVAKRRLQHHIFEDDLHRLRAQAAPGHTQNETSDAAARDAEREFNCAHADTHHRRAQLAVRMEGLRRSCKSAYGHRGHPRGVRGR